jgi:hypothetical protein
VTVPVGAQEDQLAGTLLAVARGSMVTTPFARGTGLAGRLIQWQPGSVAASNRSTRADNGRERLWRAGDARRLRPSKMAGSNPFGGSTATGRVEPSLSRTPYRGVQDMKTTRLIAGAAGASLMILATASAAPADAPVERFRFSGTERGADEVCGLPIAYESTFSGFTSVRPAPGSDEAFLAHQNYQFEDVVVLDDDDPDTTELVRIEAKLNFREQRAVLLDPDDPNVYVFTAVEAGTFRMYGTDGNLISQTPGNVKITQVFDTEGDGAPGGIVLDETVVSHGPPVSVDFCEVLVAELT